MTSKTVRSAMTNLPITVPSTASVSEAASVMRESHIGDVLVMQDGKLAGLVTDRDIVVRVVARARDPKTTLVGDVCTETLVTTHPDTRLEDVEKAMRAGAIRRLPVVNDSGEPVGMLSLGDLAVTQDAESTLADISLAPAQQLMFAFG